MQNSSGARNVGVDVTRAIALIGMFVSHLSYPSGILAEVVYGFPAALFAFVAGVSMAFMSAGGARPAHFVVRGLVLVALHFGLALVPTDIYIVLGTLGICMISLAWAPKWSSRVQLLVAVVLTVVSGLVAAFGPALNYSPFMWAALMLAGMLFHRHVLGCSRRLAWGAVVGLALMALDIAARWYVPLPLVLDVDGHTGGVLDVVGSVGTSIGICSACCVVARRWQVVLPRMGRMPLTLYCLHVVSSPFVGLWVTLAGATAMAAAWLHVFRRGPVEEAVRRIVGAGVHCFEKWKGKGNEEDRRIDAGSGDARSAAGVGDGVANIRR
ncbi:DUF1624 domain-containing protein [Corynebacterium jeddahense]|uniref:DUF418 domain-containing protein n=1 Tax=Corynebacterium jeddahense TaxID=1414719 RepID=A0ABY7UIT7_9CORY|nr:DUF1624 domain-containing protein [Corynebacterium jeddahense]WCZ38541.1 hypothetical protein CJEDD_04640 [Corynebacterium jeddahense]